MGRSAPTTARLASWDVSARPNGEDVWISRHRPDPAKWGWALRFPRNQTFRRRV